MNNRNQQSSNQQLAGPIELVDQDDQQRNRDRQDEEQPEQRRAAPAQSWCRRTIESRGMGVKFRARLNLTEGSVDPEGSRAER
jgi:hypothetical protein